LALIQEKRIPSAGYDEYNELQEGDFFFEKKYRYHSILHLDFKNARAKRKS